MKKIFFIFLSLFFLAACSGGQADLTSFSNVRTKPAIPQKKPAIPTEKSLQANVMGALGQTQKIDEVDMARLLRTIDTNISQSNITTQDIERGWYFGRFDEKRVGTPLTWFWISKGNESIWASPGAADESDDLVVEKLCQSTAGTYAFSCIEREIPTCEHIAKSLCRCIEGTQWVDKQGCIALDSQGELAGISSDDLKRGWYLGLPNEKKLDTPNGWAWLENGKQSRWQSPNPLNQD